MLILLIPQDLQLEIIIMLTHYYIFMQCGEGKRPKQIRKLRLF